MSFNKGDRVRVTASPFTEAVPNGAEGTVIEADFGVPGGVFVKLDDVPLPVKYQAMAALYGFTEGDMWPLQESELEVVA